MIKTGVLLLTVLFAIGCTASPEPRPAHKRFRPGILFPEAQHQPGKTVPPPAPPKPALQSPQPKAPVQYSRPTVKRAPAFTIPRTFNLPSVIHHKDQSIMVRVPAGSYWVPSQPVSPFVVGENTRMERQHVNEFFMDRAEITVAQYQQFNPQYDETRYTGGEACPQCPVMAVNWFEAQRYCQWAGKRLPTESEWETAARGTSDHRFPWGDQPLAGYGNIQGDRDGFVDIAPPGSLPLGASPFGALDMIGNVWEWVSTQAMLSPMTESGESLTGDSRHLVKGGSWRSPDHMATISYRNLVDPQIKNPRFGFRCAKSAVNENESQIKNPLQD